MPRFEIAWGELLQSFEPHDLPGAFILTHHRVIDPTGAVESSLIEWSGPGEWIESRDGVPKGYNALWLGARDATRPHIVFVEREPTAISREYEAAYRRAFTAKRRPAIRTGTPQPTVDGLRDGWRDRCEILARKA